MLNININITPERGWGYKNMVDPVKPLIEAKPVLYKTKVMDLANRINIYKLYTKLKNRITPYGGGGRYSR